MSWKFTFDVVAIQVGRGSMCEWSVFPESRRVQNAVEMAVTKLKTSPLLDPNKNGKVTVMPGGGPMIDNIRFNVAMAVQEAVRRVRAEMDKEKKNQAERDGTTG